MKISISKSQYYELTGLILLATKHSERITEIIQAMRKITGEEDESGHCSDAIYAPYTVDELIRRLRIKVREQ